MERVGGEVMRIEWQYTADFRYDEEIELGTKEWVDDPWASWHWWAAAHYYGGE